MRHVLSRIEVVEPPVKMNYFEGETFDPAGLVVAAIYEDGHKEILSLEGDSTNTEVPMILPDSTTLLTEENDKVTISYGGKLLALPLTVEMNSQWNHFDFTLTVQIRTRPTTMSAWTEWRTATGADGIYNNTIMALGSTDAGLKQYRTILRLNSDSLDVAFKNEKGLKLLLYKYLSYGYSSAQGHILVNGNRRIISKNMRKSNPH